MMCPKFLVLIAVVLLFSGCSSIFPESMPEQVYALRVEAAGEPCQESFTTKPVILLRDVRASGLIAGTRIVFSADELKRDYYKQARWSEPFPARLLTELLLFLESSGNFGSVGRIMESNRDGMVLSLEVLDGYHNSAFEPGEVILKVRAQLQLVGNPAQFETRTFEGRADATEYSARGAVEGYRMATRQVFTKIMQWICSSA